MVLNLHVYVTWVDLGLSHIEVVLRLLLSPDFETKSAASREDVWVDWLDRSETLTNFKCVAVVLKFGMDPC